MFFDGIAGVDNAETAERMLSASPNGLEHKKRADLGRLFFVGTAARWKHPGQTGQPGCCSSRRSNSNSSRMGMPSLPRIGMPGLSVSRYRLIAPQSTAARGEAAALAEANGVQIVVGGDQPQTAAAHLPGALGDPVDQRAANARPLR